MDIFGGFGPGGGLGWALGFGSCPDLLTKPDPSSLRVAGGPSSFGAGWPPGQDSYLVDSASSHMLVSKIKPCMSKYKQSIR